MDKILGYWWLIFLLPVFGGIIRSTFGGFGRSRRRLERDRGGRDSRRVAAGGSDYGPAAPLGKTAEQSRQEEALRLFADHDAVNSRWLAYELDVAKLIDFPMMSDVREPLTVEFLRAKRLADGLRPAVPTDLASDGQLSEYRQALRNFEVAFDVAEREAKRIKDAHYSEPERQRLCTAKKLLSMAVDEASTQAERQLAYHRARKELDGLLLLPDEAVAALERRVQAQIRTTPNAPGSPDRAEGPLLKPAPRPESAG
jgi:hypothetical protein